jgi:hypothetical protein
MVVPVLITNCHTSEKRNIGPSSAQTGTTAQAARRPRAAQCVGSHACDMAGSQLREPSRCDSCRCNSVG